MFDPKPDKEANFIIWEHQIKQKEMSLQIIDRLIQYLKHSHIWSINPG